MRMQISWQNMKNLEKVEFIDERYLNNHDEMRSWIKEIRDRFPEDKEGYVLVLCNEKSKFFVHDAVSEDASVGG